MLPRDETAGHHRFARAVETLPDGKWLGVTLLKLNELSSTVAADDASGISVASLKASTHRAITRAATCLTVRHARHFGTMQVGVTSSLAISDITAFAMTLVHPLEASALIFFFKVVPGCSLSSA